MNFVKMTVQGIEIYGTPYMTSDIWVRRPWRERLFSWPWKPLTARKMTKSYRIIMTEFEGKQIGHCSLETFHQIQKELNEMNKYVTVD